MPRPSTEIDGLEFIRHLLENQNALPNMVNKQRAIFLRIHEKKHIMYNKCNKHFIAALPTQIPHLYFPHSFC